MENHPTFLDRIGLSSYPAFASIGVPRRQRLESMLTVMKTL
jgi:hypothetical protein